MVYVYYGFTYCILWFLSLVQQDLNTANNNIFGYFAVNIQQNNHIHKKLLHFAVLFASIVGKNGSFAARNEKNEIIAVNMQQIQIKKSNLLY